MAVGTRWNNYRLEQKMSKALKVANKDILSEYEEAAQSVAKPIEAAIRASGRGGSHNADFAHQETRVFQSRAGRFNVLLGWLNPPGDAHERGDGGKLWYQYQDAGFRLFGGSQWIEGVGATIDRRENLINALEDVNRRWIDEVRGAFR